jgi:hypothetical protein
LRGFKSEESLEKEQLRVVAKVETLYANRNRIVRPHGPSPEKECRVDGRVKTKFESGIIRVAGKQAGNRAGRRSACSKVKEGIAKGTSSTVVFSTGKAL